MPDTIKFSFLTLFLLLLFQGCSNPFQNEQDGSNDPIWIQVASAEHQCITPDYSSLEDALNQLKANHVLVLNSQELNLATCRACSCPTGIVYQAEINGKSLHIALNLGWQQVDEDDDTP